MQHEKDTAPIKDRLLYGAIVGAIIGFVIGTMPQNDPRAAGLAMGCSAALIASLCVLSRAFWESLRAAWELLRMAFWRW